MRQSTVHIGDNKAYALSQAATQVLFNKCSLTTQRKEIVAQVKACEV